LTARGGEGGQVMGGRDKGLERRGGGRRLRAVRTVSWRTKKIPALPYPSIFKFLPLSWLTSPPPYQGGGGE
jgi:hypothetical protein